MKISNGQMLWRRAKGLIPGGTQLLSKRCEQFLPDQWPAYMSSADGATVCDLDGNKFIDMHMGIGSVMLGYRDPVVNRAVKGVIDAGNMSTLNSPEEVELAELLTYLHKWAGMVRYTRSAGEACAVAIRIARAFTGKDKVAFSGYHGFHDWYLAANLADDKNLDGQLLPGLQPRGVPRALKGTAIPFNYGDIPALEQIMEDDEVGTIIVEPIRNREEPGYLKELRRVADKSGAVLIFDEVSSGFRVCVGGYHLTKKVDPDLCVLGKAMSNGYPMAAIIGGREVMQAAQETFISSTYWTERIGPAAALATIGQMLELHGPTRPCSLGTEIADRLRASAAEHGVGVEVHDAIPSLPGFVFTGDDALVKKTLFTQTMLDNHFIASTSAYMSYAHTYEDVRQYLYCADWTFDLIKKAGPDVSEKLRGPVAHAGFRRLT